jgi:hypothetical protein
MGVGEPMTGVGIARRAKAWSTAAKPQKTRHVTNSNLSGEFFMTQQNVWRLRDGQSKKSNSNILHKSRKVSLTVGNSAIIRDSPFVSESGQNPDDRSRNPGCRPTICDVARRQGVRRGRVPPALRVRRLSSAGNSSSDRLALQRWPE